MTDCPSFKVSRGIYADPETFVAAEALVVESAVIDEEGLVDDPWGLEAIRLSLIREYGDRLPKVIVYVRSPH